MPTFCTVDMPMATLSSDVGAEMFMALKHPDESEAARARRLLQPS